ncbi:MAG: translation elongation factor Ts [Kofleriaceae bacterium]|jgi:elongation factor Ts|nr:translation elongation factor Ts [Kofleriaceae bacterium]MBP6837682.1 translation elongation factor Ts [Kofleriaceae bacterium]MBP9203607.1 translation elongation factor Ts [Kofleriaceae bacterium]
MSEVSATMIKDLRERTGAGMSDCKKALVEVAGDIDKAIDYLRAKGLAKAAKKAGRDATEGTVLSYIHGGGRIGVLVEVNCETDFVGRGEDFQGFARDVAMQIAAMAPQFVRKEEVSEDLVAREREVLLAKARESGKPEAVIAKMVDGQVSKWLKEICLMDQSFVKNPDKTIDQLQQELIAKIGENIKVRRFIRFELGEGLEKKKDDFAAEVAKQAGLA